MKKTVKLLSAILALVMCLSVMPIAAFAEEDTQTVQEGQYSVSVSAVKEPDYNVILPKSIVLDSATNTGSYTVEVSGNIGVNQVIRVIPDESFEMVCGDKTISATITQEQQEVNCTEALEGVTITGTITLSEIPTGSWNGGFGFKVELVDIETESEA